MRQGKPCTHEYGKDLSVLETYMQNTAGLRLAIMRLPASTRTKG